MDNYKFHFHEDTFDRSDYEVDRRECNRTDPSGYVDYYQSDKNPPSLQEEDVEQQQQHFPHDYQNHNETVNISRPPLRQQHSLHSHHHHPHHPNHHHTVWKGRQNTYRETFIKTIYLTCATIITTCFIIECILIHLVILPCQHESGFLPTECTYVKTELVASSVKCENKCSKDRSTFQCIRVLVTYSRLNENFTASLFDNIATYQYYHSLGCATSSCHRQNSANHEWVEHFCQLIKKAARFPCYVHEDHIKEALLHKFYGPSTMFNTLFWPLFLLCLSSLCLLITWSFDRCHVWHDEKTIIA